MDNACKHYFQWWENTSIGIQQQSPTTNRELTLSLLMYIQVSQEERT